MKYSANAPRANALPILQSWMQALDRRNQKIMERVHNDDLRLSKELAKKVGVVGEIVLCTSCIFKNDAHRVRTHFTRQKKMGLMRKHHEGGRKDKVGNSYSVWFRYDLCDLQRSRQKHCVHGLPRRWKRC